MATRNADRRFAAHRGRRRITPRHRWQQRLPDCTNSCAAVRGVLPNNRLSRARNLCQANRKPASGAGFRGVANGTRTRDHRDHNFAWLEARGVTIGRGRVPTRLVTSPGTRHESRLVTDCCHNVATTKPTGVVMNPPPCPYRTAGRRARGCLLRPLEPLTRLLVPPKLAGWAFSLMRWSSIRGDDRRAETWSLGLSQSRNSPVRFWQQRELGFRRLTDQQPVRSSGRTSHEHQSHRSRPAC